MKKTIALFLVLNLAMIQFGSGQTKRFVPSPELNKFVGTWVWQAGDTTITLVLKKNIVELNLGSVEFLEGTHIYKIGSKIVEHSNDLTLTKGTRLMNKDRTDTNTITVHFSDRTKRKSGIVTLRMLPGKKDTMLWDLIEPEGIHVSVPGEKKWDHGFTFPLGMVFKKRS